MRDIVRLPFLIIFLLILFVGCSPKASSRLPVLNMEAQLQGVLDSILTAHPTAIGLMAHVEAPDQNISWSGAAGRANKEKQQALQADQPALIASNTKTYVAASILRLVEQGKLNLDQAIHTVLTEKTNALLVADGYKTETIWIGHLLSHTSGIFDYVNADRFFASLESDPMYHWTRDEQIKMAVEGGDPLGEPLQQFSYADTNYSLLSEIIEQTTGKPFYTAIRELLAFDKHGLANTWWSSLEEPPAITKALAHQYVGDMSINSYSISPTFDLYGGGGIAATTQDLARFAQLLFSKQLFEKQTTLKLLLTEYEIPGQDPANYYFGIGSSKINGYKAYGHGGFWGTVVQHFPELNASISVFVLERDKRILRRDLLEKLVGIL